MYEHAIDNNFHVHCSLIIIRYRKEIIDTTRVFRTNYEMIKQRAIRACLLTRTLIDVSK
jgi:hypothetical protein